MRSKMSMIVITLGILQVPIFAAARMSRDVAVPELVSHLSAANTLTVDREQFLVEARGELEKRAREILPDELEGHSEESLAKVLKAPLVLAHNDSEYVRDAIELHLFGIKAQLAYQLEYPPLSGQQRDEMVQSVDGFVAAMRKSMTGKLVKDSMFTAIEIDGHLNSVQKTLLGRLGDPSSKYLTKPVERAGLGKILAEFDKRLADSIERIPGRLNSGPRDEKGVPFPVYAKMLRGQVLDEITRPAVKVFLEASTDPERAGIRPDKYVPGFEDLARRLQQREQELNRATR